ncbi:helix-turn-helix transcriptional regulator [Enterococcus cecorum]|uniref:helix-turn-helix transcriptional regulator n=1 Tax=Enterococcus cecorum TaxID=44008 RepID=UPI002ACA4168|nr:helix-turn-helix domain-containing protein [Enterococcus cecorum]MDZ5560942.1 helix-turn-helix domain-containing protein [Enterococcus cecorum]
MPDKTRVKGYRVMLGLTQKEMAAVLGLSVQSYYLKENGRVKFTYDEMRVFRDRVQTIMPDVTIDDIFFT